MIVSVEYVVNIIIIMTYVCNFICFFFQIFFKHRTKNEWILSVLSISNNAIYEHRLLFFSFNFFDLFVFHWLHESKLILTI